MRIIKPYVEIPPIDGVRLLKNIERYGRACYRSEGNITNDSYTDFIRKLLKSGHESVLEHEKITVKFVVDRGVSHEIVRHRIASFSQESTRYCNYSQGRFGEEITVIEPWFFLPANTSGYQGWQQACESCEKSYLWLLEGGATPQEARSVLPNSLKTEIVVTFNLREWRHFFKLRCDKAAHPQMQQVAIPLLRWFAHIVPQLVGDIEHNRDFPRWCYAEVREVEEGQE